jgi:hypothetical protein
MFIGHAAVALAAKPLLPRVNLALPLAAAFWVDMVWPVFLLFGIEQVRIDPGNTAFTPLDFVHYPWTHSLVAAIVWSVLFSLVFLRKGKFEALILGLLVFSHWILDAISHRPDLPLWPGSGTMIGFLAIAYLGNVLGPPPPNVHAIAIAGIAGGALFTGWAWWVDQHRGQKP